ncbi:MAG: DUF3842 family protein [Thermincolia bacterium]
MKIAIVDGLGGGIGKVLVEKIRKEFLDDVEIWAFGTNAVATSLMVKAGSDEGATGENAVRCNINKVDVVVGTLSIIIADSMMGELTPGIANAIGASETIKLLLPLNRSKVTIIGSQVEPLPHLADELIKQLHKIIKERMNGHV